MERGKKRMRLKSTSTELRSRSASATPSPTRSTNETSATFQDLRSKARRALLINIARSLPARDIVSPPLSPPSRRQISPTPPHSSQLSQQLPSTSSYHPTQTPKLIPGPSKAHNKPIPEGLLRITDKFIEPQTSGGHMRNYQLSLNKRFELQKEDLSRHVSALQLYVKKCIFDQACAVARPRSSSTAVEAPIPTASGYVSGPAVQGQGSACIAQSALNVASVDADVRPSTSGVAETSGRAARGYAASDFDTDYDDEFKESNIENVGLPGRVRDIPDDDELDRPTREMIDAAQRAMDDEVDRLGVSDCYNWDASFDSFRGVPEQFTGPRPGPIKEYDSAYDAFTDIWSVDIMEHIVRETNRYAQQTIDKHMAEGTVGPTSRLRQWRDTDVDEMFTLFAIQIYMGIDRRTSQDEYWRTNFDLEMPRFGKIMSYDRYILLSKLLHFTDNVDVSQRHQQYGGVTLSPKVAKIAPLLSHLDTKFSSLYNLSRRISIDESLTLYKGRLSWAQAIRSKATRFGIKSYELCESETGYLSKFQIYTGKNSDDVGSGDIAPSADLGSKSTKIVLDLLKGLEGLGHCVTMDNFYNSPALARYLKSKGFDCLGTLRVNRKHVPKEIAEASPDVPKGTIIARQCGDVSLLTWKDSKLVTMISTYHNVETYVGSRAGRPLVKPLSVWEYNKTMEGVNRKDQNLSTYLLEQKRCVKWYVMIFKRLLNTSVHNAFIMLRKSLERRNLMSLTHRIFRYELADALVNQHRQGMPQHLEPMADLMRLRRDVVHCPKHSHGSKNRKRCIICLKQGICKKVLSQCATCEVYLCFENCWKIWHSQAVLEEQVRGRKRRRSE